MKRGRWIVIDDARPEDGVGALRALFCDGIIIAAYCRSLHYGHWQVSAYGTRIFTDGPTSATLVADESTAEKLCLAIAQLSEDDLETTEIPAAFRAAFDEE